MKTINWKLFFFLLIASVIAGLMVLPYAAGQALAQADAGTLSASTRYYYETARSRPVQDNVARVIAAQPDTAELLQSWLERDDFLDTVTHVMPIENNGRYEAVYNLSLLDINSYVANGLLPADWCGALLDLPTVAE